MSRCLEWNSTEVAPLSQKHKLDNKCRQGYPTENMQFQNAFCDSVYHITLMFTSCTWNKVSNATTLQILRYTEADLFFVLSSVWYHAKTSFKIQVGDIDYVNNIYAFFRNPESKSRGELNQVSVGYTQHYLCPLSIDLVQLRRGSFWRLGCRVVIRWFWHSCIYHRHTTHRILHFGSNLKKP